VDSIESTGFTVRAALVPELPEVEVVRRGLAPAVTGSLVTSVEVRDARALTRHSVALGDFERLLTGARIAAAVRRGKFLWFPLSGTDTALLSHLGMSGQLLLRRIDSTEENRHTRVRLGIEHPEHGEFRVDFVDQRTFGSLAIDRMIEVDATAGYSSDVTGQWARSIPHQVAHIARDLLDPAFDEKGWLRALARRTSGIKTVLLDQTLLSGIGNIYADEALWAVGMAGTRPAASLSRGVASNLLAAVRIVLEKALAEGGTSFDAQYVNVNGQAGYFAHSLSVYGRTGEPCPRCATPIVREPFANRSSHRCPRCQRR